MRGSGKRSRPTACWLKWPASSRISANTQSNREAGAAAAGGGRLRVVDLERGADQVVHEIDLGAGKIAERNLVDQHGRAVTRDHHVVGRLDRKSTRLNSS